MSLQLCNNDLGVLRLALWFAWSATAILPYYSREDSWRHVSADGQLWLLTRVIVIEQEFDDCVQVF